MGASCLYTGQVMHQRRQPGSYRFRYRVFSLLLDIDELDFLDRDLRFFSRNRFNLLSFHDRDHGPQDGSDLRRWIARVLATAGLEADGPIRLLCFPRVLGYGFSPLAVWYCHAADERLIAVILEVRNTFGEKHQYLLPMNNDSSRPPPAWTAPKAFHVSPFATMDAHYRFRLRIPDKQMLVRVDTGWDAAGQYQMSACWTGKRRPLMDASLLRQALGVPLQGLKIISLIHWQALKLWLRCFPFYRKPSPPDQEVSLTCPQASPLKPTHRQD